MSPIADHPLRYTLANELHARPNPSLASPATGVYLALQQPGNPVDRNRQADLDHLIQLLDRHGADHPRPGATHWSGQIGRHLLKWESHTEFVTYTAYCDGISDRAFDPAEFEVFPEDWLNDAPGARVTSALIRVAPRMSDTEIGAQIDEWFVGESLAAARVLEDEAVAAADFRIDPAGHMRFAVFTNPDLGRRRIGRVIQRLCEIETYKAMSMQGFALTREISGRMTALDGELTALIGAMRNSDTRPDATLTGLLAASAELEEMGATTAFRFGATEAYEAIVHDRIEVLRETRFRGRQTFGEFMKRRYDPAMRTVNAANTRLAKMADRAIRAGELLRTRVDVERSAQNQALLESMDRRADLQLRLQETVEGLSVVAISYYAVSLASYLAYPLGTPLGLSKGMMTSMITLPVVLAVWWMVRRIRARVH